MTATTGSEQMAIWRMKDESGLVYLGAYGWMRDLVGADVVEKTAPRRNW